MKDKIIIIWKNLSESYWFIPSLMICAVWFVLVLMLRIDASLTAESWILSNSWIIMGSTEAARQLLASIVGSLITVIGLLFSMTMIVFTLASSQYGPQVMRHFLGDRVTQIVLGTLVSTFIYCLLILRSIGTGSQSDFIPHISITFALILTLVSLYMLIYFIHHVSLSIQPQSIIKNLGDELNECLLRLFPDKLGEEDPSKDEKASKEKLLILLDKEGMPVYSPKGGYVQAIANDNIINITKQQNVKVQLNIIPGDFIVAGAKIAVFYPKAQDQEKLFETICKSVMLGNQRTTHQDIKYAIERIVAIAIRALSPGINEPFISIMCIDFLSLSIRNLSLQGIPASVRLDENKEIRIIVKTTNFKDIIEASFDQILHYGESNPMIQGRIKNNLCEISSLIEDQHYKSEIHQYIGKFL